MSDGSRVLVAFVPDAKRVSALAERADKEKIRSMILVATNAATWRALHTMCAPLHAIGRSLEVFGDWELRRPPGPPHAVCSAEETQRLLRTFGASSLPRIWAGDPQCRWLGARVGSVVRVQRPTSDVGGVEDHFRLVVRGDALAFRATCLRKSGGPLAEDA